MSRISTSEKPYFFICSFLSEFVKLTRGRLRPRPAFGVALCPVLLLQNSGAGGSWRELPIRQLAGARGRIATCNQGGEDPYGDTITH